MLFKLYTSKVTLGLSTSTQTARVRRITRLTSLCSLPSRAREPMWGLYSSSRLWIRVVMGSTRFIAISKEHSRKDPILSSIVEVCGEYFSFLSVSWKVQTCNKRTHFWVVSVLVMYLMVVCFRGYKRFFRRSGLQSSEYLKDNIIVSWFVAVSVWWSRALRDRGITISLCQ